MYWSKRKYLRIRRAVARKYSKKYGGQLKINSALARRRMPYYSAKNVNVGKGLYYFKFHNFSFKTFSGNPADIGYSTSESFVVKADDFPNAIECASVFDQYKIKKAWMTITFKGGNVDDIDDVLTAGQHLPTIYWINDLDDTAIINSNSLMQHSKLKRFQFGNGARMKVNINIPCYVKNAIAGIDSTTLLAEQVKRSPWIDFARTDIKHGCTKIIVRNPDLSTADDKYSFDVDYHVLMECRTVR